MNNMCGGGDDGKNVVEMVTGHCLTNSKNLTTSFNQDPSCAHEKKKRNFQKQSKLSLSVMASFIIK